MNWADLVIGIVIGFVCSVGVIPLIGVYVKHSPKAQAQMATRMSGFMIRSMRKANSKGGSNG